MSDLKHFNENDVEFAKHLAKLSVNQEKVNIKPSNLASDIKPKAISFDIALNDGKNNLPSDFDELHRSHPSGSQKQKKHREGNMRIKQAMRTACDLATIIERLNRKSKEKQRESSFITPLELEKKNKRWDDFSHLARRTLYPLKREVNLLSVKVTTPLTNLPDSSLRLLASATRNCLHVLKGLENFEDEIKEKQKGNFLLRETLLTGQHLLFIMTMGGASVTTKNSSNIKTEYGETSEENLTKSFEILTSDMDSKVSELLNPNAVKKKLSTLVQSLKAKNRKAKSQKMKYISPLQDELDYVDNSKKSFYPICEDLDDGRKIEFVNDSLSPKLRKRNPRHVRKISSSRHRRNDGNESSPRKNQSPEEDVQYGVSEKMADAVFERILPYINGIEDKEVAGASRPPNNSNVEIVVLFEAQKKLDELQRRFRKLETTTQKHKQFLAKIKSKLSKNTKESSDALDLEKVIKKANICLEKCSKSENTFPYQESSVDVIVDNLFMARAQETDQKLLTKKSEFTSMHDEVQALKIEFWNSMADKHVIQPSTSGIPPLTSVMLPSTSTSPPLHFTSTSVDILGKKEENEGILKDDMREEHVEGNSEEIFYKRECHLSPNGSQSMEKENQSVPRDSLQDMVAEDEKEEVVYAMQNKSEPIITQKSPSQSSTESENSKSIVISESVNEDRNHESSEAIPNQINTDASAEQTSGHNTENSSKDF